MGMYADDLIDGSIISESLCRKPKIYNKKPKCPICGHVMQDDFKCCNKAIQRKPKFIIGVKYRFKYKRKDSMFDYCGDYEYMRNRGGKYHFYDNENGVDAFFTKDEALKYLQDQK